MPKCSVCRIVGNLEIRRDDVKMRGIISASLSATTEILRFVEDPQNPTDDVFVLGPTQGTLSITAYPYITELDVQGRYKPRGDIPFGDRILGGTCKGRAGVSIEWVRRFNCDENRLYFIPKAGSRSFIEGEFPSDVLRFNPQYSQYAIGYGSFQADASQGPYQPYMINCHTDGFDLEYLGGPISFTSESPFDLGQISVIDTQNGEQFDLSGDAEFYLSSFELTVEPPYTSRVTYQFIFYYPNAVPCGDNQVTGNLSAICNQ